ncbi:MAG: SIR2 family protein [Angustibacter sp.]
MLPRLEKGAELRACLERVAGQSHLSYLLGAGASVAAGLPTWTGLLTQLLTSRGLSEPAATALLAGQDALLAAEAAFTVSARPAQRQRRIFRALYGTSDTSSASMGFTRAPMHQAIAEAAAVREPDQVTLMTLNYDDLLEEALVAELAARRGVSTREALKWIHARASASPRHSGRYEIHHLHGLLPRESTRAQGDDLILTLSDYNALMTASAPWQRSQIQHALQSGPMVMVGTSYSDPDVRMFLGQLRDQGLGEVVALVPRQGLGLSAGDLALVRSVIVDQWAKVGVTCHVLEDFAEVTQVLREAPYVTQADYRPPRERVAAVLTGRESRFSRVQPADARLLEEQVHDLLQPVHAGPVNLTLWLHDGNEELVRWAAGDRTYRKDADLRRVPATLESPWIAAEALCAGVPHVRAIQVDTTVGDGLPQRTGRWGCVMAHPVEARLPGGPAVPVGVLSSAFTAPLADVDQERWGSALGQIAATWSSRLSR